MPPYAVSSQRVSRGDHTPMNGGQGVGSSRSSASIAYPGCCQIIGRVGRGQQTRRGFHQTKSGRRKQSNPVIAMISTLPRCLLASIRPRKSGVLPYRSEKRWLSAPDRTYRSRDPFGKAAKSHSPSFPVPQALEEGTLSGSGTGQLSRFHWPKELWIGKRLGPTSSDFG